MPHLSHAMRLVILWKAQNGICAGCGREVRKRISPNPCPDDPSFDHVASRASGGSNGLRNGILKHRRCNAERADKPANGCDLIWFEAVRVRLARARQNRRKAARQRERAVSGATAHV